MTPPSAPMETKPSSEPSASESGLSAAAREKAASEAQREEVVEVEVAVSRAAAAPRQPAPKKRADVEARAKATAEAVASELSFLSSIVVVGTYLVAPQISNKITTDFCGTAASCSHQNAVDGRSTKIGAVRTGRNLVDLDGIIVDEKKIKIFTVALVEYTGK